MRKLVFGILLIAATVQADPTAEDACHGLYYRKAHECRLARLGHGIDCALTPVLRCLKRFPIEYMEEPHKVSCFVQCLAQGTDVSDCIGVCD